MLRKNSPSGVFRKPVEMIYPWLALKKKPIKDFNVTISWQPIPWKDDIAYYEIEIYEKDVPSTNRTCKTSKGAVHTYIIVSNFHPGKLFGGAKVWGVTYTDDKVQGVWRYAWGSLVNSATLFRQG